MTLVELRSCIELLLRHAAARGVREIGVPEPDHYWTVSSPDWRRIYDEPKPSVGSFADDAAELVKLLRDPSRASAVDLDRVASLLRLLSDTLAD
jgi:hypothetical protein